MISSEHTQRVKLSQRKNRTAHLGNLAETRVALREFRWYAIELRVLDDSDEHTGGVEFLHDSFVVTIFREFMLKTGELTRNSVRKLGVFCESIRQRTNTAQWLGKRPTEIDRDTSLDQRRGDEA